MIFKRNESRPPCPRQALAATLLVAEPVWDVGRARAEVAAGGVRFVLPDPQARPHDRRVVPSSRCPEALSRFLRKLFAAEGVVRGRGRSVLLRQLRDGDDVVVNRQPTLHKNGIMRFRARIVAGLTVQLPLPATTPFNADFDGDEVNLHVPDGAAARAEARELMSIERLMVSAAAGRPVVGLVQNALVAAYLLTAPDATFDRAEVAAVAARAGLPASLLRVDPPGSRETWTGLQVASLAVRHATPGLTFRSGKLRVVDGEIVAGRLGKREVGAGAEGGLFHVAWLRGPPAAAMRLLDALQRVCAAFLSGSRSLSFGLSDLIWAVPGGDGGEREGEGEDGGEGEDEAAHLGRLAGRAERARRGLVARPGNRMMAMVESGSKGKPSNVSQLVAALGQQTLSGSRLQDVGRDRVFSYDRPAALRRSRAEDDRARGYVGASFVRGLTVREHLLHLVAGREGMTDTCIVAPKVGDRSRQMGKITEDCVVRYDGTVRGMHDEVVAFRYFFSGGGCAATRKEMGASGGASGGGDLVPGGCWGT